MGPSVTLHPSDASLAIIVIIIVILLVCSGDVNLHVAHSNWNGVKQSEKEEKGTENL